MLFELADHAGQEIDRVGIALLFGDATRAAATVEVRLDALGQQLDVFQVARRLLRVLGYLRMTDVASTDASFTVNRGSSSS